MPDNIGSIVRDFKSDMFLGHPMENFACIQCGAAAESWLCLAMRIDNVEDEKPSVVHAYGLCGRCRTLYWDEAGGTFYDAMHDAFKEPRT